VKKNLVLLLLMLTAASGVAQPLPEAPSSSRPIVFGYSASSFAANSPNPAVESPWDRSSLAIEFFKWSAVVADIETTRAAVSTSRCQEMVPLYGSHPSRLRLYGIMGSLEAAHSFAGYRLRRSGRAQKLSKITGLMSGAGHAFAAVSNSHCM
jgi:hypothetical protein